ncbi:hypothetical protein LPJ73_000205 [Coemansia sp. RSA 2703]|nr:hypothetical protein LPJ73_000205 [Coemansia sp. RSA 2703]
MVIKLITADGAVIKVEREVIEQSGTVRNILNDVRMTDKPIPLPNVSGPILTKIIQYCEHHKDDASRRQAKPSNHDLESDCSEAAVQKAIAKIDDFDRDFCLVDQGTLFDLISAANFLDIQPLVDLVGYTVASMMKGKSVEEIRKTFGIKSDFSTKEEERVRKDNACDDFPKMQKNRAKVDKFVISREKEAVTHLFPGLFPAGRQAEWTEQNRTLTFAIHPTNNKLALAVAGKQPRESIKRDIKTFEQDQTVTICGLASVPDERVSFVNDTHAVFVELQNTLSDKKGVAGSSAVGVEGVLRLSGQYREAIQKQVRVLQESGVDDEFIKEEIETFQSMHGIWHLLEIMYLTTNTPGLSTSVVSPYMKWLNANFTTPLVENGKRLAEGSPTADELARRPGLWEYLKKLALRGHVSALANVLERLAPSQQLSTLAAQWVETISQSAKRMPIGSSEETSGSFRVRWKQWNQEMKDTAKSIAGVLQDGSSNSEDSALQALKTISEIMSGNVDAISTESEYWQDILGAVMLYSEPTAQVDRLPSLIGAIMEQYESSDLTDLDRVLIALLSHDLPTFLILCSHIDPWLSAHTADLMHHLGILDTCRRVFPLDPREHYLVALGESYVGHEDLWRVGLDYLGLVGTRSAHGVLEECAVRLPLESDRKAEQVLRVCDTFGLNRARDRIHRQLGRMKWRQGRLGAAIGHFAQVADMASIEVICDQLWKEYLESGKLTYGSVIDSVISTGVQHERLQFLTKYRDFYESYKNAEYVEAGRIMMSILLQEIAPQSAVADLLVDTIPLLESDVLVFSSDDTFELMRCAEALASAEGSDAPSELTIFNAACSRNLARAFVMS